MKGGVARRPAAARARSGGAEARVAPDGTLVKAYAPYTLRQLRVEVRTGDVPTP